ncbi:DUF445 domain-containing protein [Thalassobacillus hwangdonensis]|uniref:DUF445 domain-containing protein n=2 Tax=Thalassobacillus hwangdonensis TaxID=546108 RepID=A0ABW3KWS2_9BACI
MAIGALIGGMTNSLAIKMLFRPYKAVYFGKFKLPFTPGLIPKRREELAKQLGKMVVNHLLTSDGIKKKLVEARFQKTVTEWAQKEVHLLLNKEESIQKLLGDYDIDIQEAVLKQKVSEWVVDTYHQHMTEIREKSIKDNMSPHWIEKAETGVDELSGYIQMQIHSYLESEEGKRKISALIDDYLESQGMLGSMIASFMGPDGLTERVHPAIVKYVKAPETKEWLHELLKKELDYWMDQPVRKVEDKVGGEAIASAIGTLVSSSLPLNQWLNRTVKDWTTAVQPKIIESLVPQLVQKGTTYVANRVDTILSSLQLDLVVEEQVEAFSVERLEEMVLDISRREFKMITYLGALLGGLIGLVQGAIVLIFG